MSRSLLVPTVVESTPGGERGFDIYSRLLRDRVVFVTGPIDDDLAGLTIAQLLFLEAEDRERPVDLYIHSPGGSASAGLAIYDTMQVLAPAVRTTCLGLAASAAALLLVGGAAGERASLPNSRMLLHQPSAGFQGQASDVRIHAAEVADLRRRVDRILAQHTGQPVEQVHADTERDHFLGPEAAIAYGLIDRVVARRAPAPSGRGSAG